MLIKHPKVGSYLSGATAYGGIVCASGLAADDISQDLPSQTAQTLANIDRVLAQAGSG